MAFGAGFGCGVLWLGVAFMLGHRLRHRQPLEALDLLWEDGVSQSSTPGPGAAPPRLEAIRAPKDSVRVLERHPNGVSALPGYVWPDVPGKVRHVPERELEFTDEPPL